MRVGPSDAKDCLMKITKFHWRWALPLAAAVMCDVSLAAAQQPVLGIDLIQPIEATPLVAIPIEASPAESDDDAAEQPAEEPTEAQPGADLRDPVALPSDEDEQQADERPRELIKERFGNGAIRIEREMIQDAEGNFVHDGLYRQYDLQGTLIAVGEYRNGKREGAWQRIHAASESSLFQTAPYKEYKGPFLSQANFKDGLLEGKWVIADAEQRKVSEISFSGGERHGDSVWFYPNGSLMMKITYDRGRVHGDVVKWGPDSSIVMKERFQNGRQLTVKTEYHKKDVKSREISYLNAMLFVRVPDDWDRAQLAVFEARGQDEKHGPFKTWHPNGNLARQGEFRYNLPVGKINYWYENGQPQTEGAYVDGRPHGVWTWYHPNGQKSIVGEYRDGVAVGSWTWWNADGKVARKADLTRRTQTPVAKGPPQPIPEGEEREANLRIELVEPGRIPR